VRHERVALRYCASPPRPRRAAGHHHQRHAGGGRREPPLPARATSRADSETVHRGADRTSARRVASRLTKGRSSKSSTTEVTEAERRSLPFKRISVSSVRFPCPPW